MNLVKPDCSKEVWSKLQKAVTKLRQNVTYECIICALCTGMCISTDCGLRRQICLPGPHKLHSFEAPDYRSQLTHTSKECGPGRQFCLMGPHRKCGQAIHGLFEISPRTLRIVDKNIPFTWNIQDNMQYRESRFKFSVEQHIFEMSDELFVSK